MSINSVKGFTIVEFSVVVVMIGVLLAGITYSQKLVQGYKLRAVISEAKQIKASFLTFKQAHGASPGDFQYAFALWGAASGCTNNDVNTVATGCNGNGDGLIGAGSWNREGILMWLHLSYGDFYPGRFPGPGGLVSNNVIIGEHVPASAFKPAGYHFFDPATSRLGIWLEIGAKTTNDRPVTNFLTGYEASMIDKKADDGAADTGDIQANAINGYPPAGGGWADYCTTGALYNLTTAGLICRQSWRITNYN